MSQVMVYKPLNSWIIPYLKKGLKKFGWEDISVSDHWPPAGKKALWVSVRDDGASGEDLSVQWRMLHVTCSSPQASQADLLVEHVAALLRQLPQEAALPVCAVSSIHGGSAVWDKDWPHLRTLTADLLVTGSIVDL